MNFSFRMLRHANQFPIRRAPDPLWVRKRFGQVRVGEIQELLLANFPSQSFAVSFHEGGAEILFHKSKGRNLAVAGPYEDSIAFALGINFYCPQLRHCFPDVPCQNFSKILRDPGVGHLEVIGELFGLKGSRKCDRVILHPYEFFQYGLVASRRLV